MSLAPVCRPGEGAGLGAHVAGLKHRSRVRDFGLYHAARQVWGGRGRPYLSGKDWVACLALGPERRRPQKSLKVIPNSQEDGGVRVASAGCPPHGYCDQISVFMTGYPAVKSRGMPE